MKRILFVLAAALVLSGCADLTGLDRLSAYADSYLANAEVVTIACSATTLTPGTSAQCEGRGAQGQVLSIDGVSVLQWSTSDPVVLRVSLDGIVTAGQVGVADVVARGPGGSSATIAITVQ